MLTLLEAATVQLGIQLLRQAREPPGRCLGLHMSKIFEMEPYEAILKLESIIIMHIIIISHHERRFLEFSS